LAGLKGVLGVRSGGAIRKKGLKTVGKGIFSWGRGENYGRGKSAAGGNAAIRTHLDQGIRKKKTKLIQTKKKKKQRW